MPDGARVAKENTAPVRTDAPTPSPVASGPRLLVGRADAPAEHSAEHIARTVLGRLEARAGSGGTAATTPDPPSSKLRRSSAAAGAVSPDLDAAIRAERGKGQPLGRIRRRHLEEAFGGEHDFSGVRVHTDQRADTLSRALGADAFTVGSDVFAATGRLGPSKQGDEVLAHELSHVAEHDDGQIHRKVGFEFEDNQWRAWIDPLVGAIRPVKRHEKIHVGTDYHIEGDEMGNGQASLEVVTKPFDISAGGLAALDAAMVDVRAVMHRIGGFQGRDDANGQYVTPAEHQFSKWFVKLSRGNPDGQFKMQTTMGIALDDLPTLMKYIGHSVPGETAAETAERSEARMIQSGSAAAAGPGGAFGNIGAAIGSVPTLAANAVAHLRANGAGLTVAQKNAFGGPNDNRALTGFLSQVILYAKFLSITHNDYVKGKIPLMARTDFAALFKLVPENQRISLAANNAQALTDAVVTVCNAVPLLPIPPAQGGGHHDVGFAANVSLVRKLRLQNETLRDPAAPPAIAGQPLLGAHKYRAFQSLTMGDWLEGITLGVDRLTPATMNTWLKAHEPGLGTANRHRHRDNLESLGSLGGHTENADRAATGRLAIFENRGISPQANPLTPGGLMTAHQAHTAAHHYLEWLLQLKNTGNPGAFPNGAVP